MASDMSLVVAAIHGDQVTMVSDTKVSFSYPDGHSDDARTRRTYFEALPKIVLLPTRRGRRRASAEATPTPTSSSSSPAPTTTSPTQADSDIASEAASTLVAEYYATVDRLGQQPSKSLAALSTVATGVQLTAQQTALTSQRRANQKQVGDTKIANLDASSQGDRKAGVDCSFPPS